MAYMDLTDPLEISVLDLVATLAQVLSLAEMLVLALGLAATLTFVPHLAEMLAWVLMAFSLNAQILKQIPSQTPSLVQNCQPDPNHGPILLSVPVQDQTLW